ncbi:MAG: hypothetical protein PHV34_05900 [Verrucomicrobiae bacterium]|nr:hypothetical protein [Verrucomicrobiae bacterium]
MSFWTSLLSFFRGATSTATTAAASAPLGGIPAAITATATATAEVAKAATAIAGYQNTPAMIESREMSEEAAEQDELNRALKNRDIETVRRILSGLALVCLLAGCGTTPAPGRRQTIAFSGNSQTAGIGDFAEDGSMPLDDGKLYEFSSLLEKWGPGLTPPARELEAYVKLDAKTGQRLMTCEGAGILLKLKQAAIRARINGAK